MKLYYVDIDGKKNSSLKGIAGQSVHRETVSAKSHKEAKEKAWENFKNDMGDIYRAVTTRRDYKIESEDVTGVYKVGEVYFTAEEVK